MPESWKGLFCLPSLPRGASCTSVRQALPWFFMQSVGRMHHAFWRSFQHGQFAIAKAAAYSSILTLFPAFLLATSILETSHQTDRFVRQIAAAVGWVLPPGPNAIAVSFFQSGRHQTARILLSASMVTLLAA